MDGDHRRLGVALMAGVFVAIACGSAMPHLNPGTIGMGRARRKFSEIFLISLLRCWSHGRSDAGVVAFLPPGGNGAEKRR